MTGKPVSEAEDKLRAKNCGTLLRAAVVLDMLDEGELARELEGLAMAVRVGERIPDPGLFYIDD